MFLTGGAAALLAALLPRLLSRIPLSMPMVFLGLGVLGFAAFPDLPDPDPVKAGVVTTHLTEVTVIISLMGAGLAIDRPFGWLRWRSTWGLLAITMPLSIATVALLGSWLLGIGAAACVLLGAALAPTDPVLASEVQVGEPTGEDESEDEPRFTLTSEAGLNDGLAFPFTYAAIAMAAVGADPAGWLPRWLALDVVWRIGIGVLAGWLVGLGLRTLFFSARSPHLRLAEQAEGFVALAATLLAYGVAEVAEGYGFVAVFVCACAIRAAERGHGYHRVLHEYVEGLERLLTVLVLVLLGGAVARGLLAPIGVAEVVVALAFLLVIRPAAGWAGLVGSPGGRRDRAVISFFGVRGIGSLYYLAFALEQAEFEAAERLWAVVALVVVLSVVLHGVTATPVMSRLDRRRQSVTVEDAVVPTTPI